jgi:uroporphyrinogen-III decarboxylase
VDARHKAGHDTEHGIQPETQIAHVEQMVKRVREYRG